MSTYNTSLTLLAPTQTVSSSTTPSSGSGPIDTINVTSITAVGASSLTVDGLTATVNMPASVTAAGTLTIASTNGADITVDYGLVGVNLLSGTTYDVNGSSSITVEPGTIDLSLLGTSTVDFTDSTAGSFTFAGTGATSFNVVGFDAQDSLNVGGGTFSGFTDNGGGSATLTYDVGGNTVTYSISGMDPTLAAQIAADPSAYIDPDTGAIVACFLTGTRIAVPGGERAVEELAIGDLVLTVTGEARPVRWIGWRTMHRAFGDGLQVHPIRITAGALGDNLPVRDLLVSPDHALLLDGMLVQAGALVNGTTIVREKPAEAVFTYYHIELENHELVLAEGVAAETFVDNVSRGRFANYAEFVELYGEQGMDIAEMDLPRAKSARQLPESLRARIAPDLTVAA